MLTYKTSLVVIFGKSESKHWQEIAGREHAWLPDSILQVESIILVYTRHPVTPGRCNADWIDLGERLRVVALDAENLASRGACWEVIAMLHACVERGVSPARHLEALQCCSQIVEGGRGRSLGTVAVGPAQQPWSCLCC